MIFDIILAISIITFYLLIKISINKLQKDYDKLCAVYVESLDYPKLKELAENNAHNHKYLFNDLPLTYNELKLLRSKCIKKLNKIKFGYYGDGNEDELLGSYWYITDDNMIPPYTIVKQKNTKLTYIILPDKVYYLILDGIHKELVKVNSLEPGRSYQILIDSIEVMRLLGKK